MGADTTTHSGGLHPGRSRTLALRCWPPAGALVSAGDCDRAALLLAGDPVSLVLWVPSLPDGELTSAEFCRALASAATGAAVEVDPGPRAGAGGGS